MASQTQTSGSPLATAPVVAEVVRGGFVESVHHGV
ncbi:MAG: asparaginase, partial [Arsenicicoccus sp.]